MLHGAKRTLHGVKRISHDAQRTFHAVGYTSDRLSANFCIGYWQIFITVFINCILCPIDCKMLKLFKKGGGLILPLQSYIEGCYLVVGRVPHPPLAAKDPPIQSNRIIDSREKVNKLTIIHTISVPPSCLSEKKDVSLPPNCNS